METLIQVVGISSLSYRAASMGLHEHLSPPFSIVHRSREIFQATCIGTELLCIGSGLSSKLRSSMWRGPQEYITYEFFLIFPADSRMSGSSHADSFCDGWLVAVQLLFCGVLSPGLVQYSS